jgi:type II secretory pathway component PulF
MTEDLNLHETRWNEVRADGFTVLAPAEWISRKLLFFYQNNTWLRVSIALGGGLAILVTMSNLLEWRHNRLIQELNLFVQMKESANGAAVSALLRSLLKQGMPISEIPLAKANLSERI